MATVWRQLGSLVVAAIMLFGIAGCGIVPGAPSSSTSVTSHGVLLTLDLPSRRYPADALIRVPVSARNVTSRPIRLDAGSSCFPGTLTVDVLNTAGKVVDPPPVPLSFRLCQGYATVLRPGAVLRRSKLAVLYGPSLVAHLFVLTRTRAYSVSTPPLNLSLFRVRPPSATLRRSPHVSLTVSNGNGAGDVLYREEWNCWGSGNPDVGWQEAHGDRITPRECPWPEWRRVEAGYLGQPVVVVTYRSRR